MGIKITVVHFQIFTGLQHSYLDPSVPTGLPTYVETLPEKLKELGYATYLVGKWQLGHCEKAYLPTRRGFDYFFGNYFILNSLNKSTPNGVIVTA